MTSKLSKRIGNLIDLATAKALLLHLLARDPRVPWYAKAIAIGGVAYPLSPVNLIPDFIPVLGQLDDLAVLSAATFLALRLVDPAVRRELHATAEEQSHDTPLLRSIAPMLVAAVVGLVWVALLTLGWRSWSR